MNWLRPGFSICGDASRLGFCEHLMRCLKKREKKAKGKAGNWRMMHSRRCVEMELSRIRTSKMHDDLR